MKRMFKRFYAIIAIMILAMATVMLTQHFQTSEQFRNEVLRSNQESVAAMGIEINQWFDRQKLEVATASRFVQENVESEEWILEYFTLMLEENPDFASVYFATPENRMINGSGYVPDASFDATSRPWYIEAAASEETVITGFFVNASEDRTIFTIAVALRDEWGNLMGVLGADVDVKTMQTLIADYQHGGIDSTVLLDDKGNVVLSILRSANTDRHDANVAMVDAMLTESSLGQLITEKNITFEDGSGYLTANKINQTGWTMLTFIGPSAFEEVHRNILNGFLILFLYAIVIIAGMILIVNQSVLQPLMRIEQAVLQYDPEQAPGFRIQIPRSGDFQSLIDGLNAVFTRMESYLTVIRRDRIQLNRVNDELKQTLEFSTKTQTALNDQKVNLEALFNNNLDAVVRLDAHYRIAEFNEPFAKLFGYEIDSVQGKTITEVLGTEDGEMADVIRQMHAGRGVHLESVQRNRRSELMDVTINGVPILADGINRGGFIVFRDIRDRKRSEKALAKQKAVFEELFLNSTDAIAAFDIERRVTQINRNFSHLFGFEQDEILGLDIDKVITDIASRDTAQWLTDQLLEGRSVVFEGIRTGKDGRARDVQIKGVPIRFDGKTIGGYALYTDISERKRAEREILYMSYHDQLTDLYNRRFLEEEIKRLDIERNLPFSVIMADVNGLKLFNDAFGHVAGDELLKSAAHVLRNACRRDEIIARLGGDEFIILLPGTNSDETQWIVNRIERESRNTFVGALPVSLSYGWGSKCRPEETFGDVLKQVETRMYRNKLSESRTAHSRMFARIVEMLDKQFPGYSGHAERVGTYCAKLGEALGMDREEVESLRTAGNLHDIGKVALLEEVADGFGTTTDNQRHPEIGYRILSSINDLADLAEPILSHHERWDGTGYPKGLSGESIPLFSRIIALADIYDTLAGRMQGQELIEKLLEESGRRFDPELVDLFIETKIWNQA